MILESLLISTGVVALAEIGDKTQLLAFILAARFKKPLSIIAGILVATLFNHGLAGALGAWITAMVDPSILRWVLGVSFIAMAVWTLIPDFIPVLGYLDDAILLPAMVWLAVKLLPAVVVSDCRAEAAEWMQHHERKPVSRWGVVFVLLVWSLALLLLAWWWF